MSDDTPPASDLPEWALRAAWKMVAEAERRETERREAERHAATLAGTPLVSLWGGPHHGKVLPRPPSGEYVICCAPDAPGVIPAQPGPGRRDYRYVVSQNDPRDMTLVEEWPCKGHPPREGVA